MEKPKRSLVLPQHSLYHRISPSVQDEIAETGSDSLKNWLFELADTCFNRNYPLIFIKR
jgi:hypothetical protein